MANTPYHWTCPFCHRDTTITDEREHSCVDELSINNCEGTQRLKIVWVVCPNPKCKKFALHAELIPLERKTHDGRAYVVEKKNAARQWQLVPASNAKPFPSYIPKPLRDDYEEACSIRDLSPKSSATLCRRCLQGMVRDFQGIVKARLIDEIKALEDVVDAETWAAIDAVRSVGNIGAHMEMEVDVVVDVEPEEADKLIWLIETLFEDWYVARFERQKRMSELKTKRDSAEESRPKESNNLAWPNGNSTSPKPPKSKSMRRLLPRLTAD